jgi:pyruvate kinase
VWGCGGRDDRDDSARGPVRLFVEQVKTNDSDIDNRAARAGPLGTQVPQSRPIVVIANVVALTDKDIADLSTAVEIADVVEMSFVQDPCDVVRLHGELTRFGGDRLGVVPKIETRRAFERLPQLPLTAMRRPRVGVMIARGDLAVEVGYARLAELQEEILWLCERPRTCR